MIRKATSTLHVNTLNYCWFSDPDRAACLQGTSKRDRPLIQACAPARCSQSSIHPEHAPVWVEVRGSLERALQHPKTPRLEKQRLRQQIDEAGRVLSQLSDETVTGPT
jgi:hypothetical protein